MEKNKIIVYIIYRTNEDGIIMLFSKDIEPRCAICRHGKKINDDEAICSRHGIVSLRYKCRRFAYDATKRIPPENNLLEKDSFSEADFSIERTE